MFTELIVVLHLGCIGRVFTNQHALPVVLTKGHQTKGPDSLLNNTKWHTPTGRSYRHSCVSLIAVISACARHLESSGPRRVVARSGKITTCRTADVQRREKGQAGCRGGDRGRMARGLDCTTIRPQNATHPTATAEASRPSSDSLTHTHANAHTHTQTNTQIRGASLSAVLLMP